MDFAMPETLFWCDSDPNYLAHMASCALGIYTISCARCHIPCLLSPSMSSHQSLGFFCVVEPLSHTLTPSWLRRYMLLSSHAALLPPGPRGSGAVLVFDSPPSVLLLYVPAELLQAEHCKRLSHSCFMLSAAQVPQACTSNWTGSACTFTLPSFTSMLATVWLDPLAGSVHSKPDVTLQSGCQITSSN